MKLVLAGAQNPYNLENLLVAGSPNILLSYYYMLRHADRGEAVLRRAKEAGCWVLVDSGAFTFKEKYMYLRGDFIRDGVEDGVLETNPARALPGWLTQKLLDERRLAADNEPRAQVEAMLQQYQRDYVEWLKRMGHLFDAYAELDLDMLVGDHIWDWRHELRQLGIPAEPVITPHLYKDNTALRRIIVDEGFTYLGMEGGHDAEYYSSFFAQNIGPLLKPYKVRVHGWGMTTNGAMTQFPYYSVDSTTWNHGMQFGTTYLYEGSYRMSTIGNDYKSRRRQMRSKCELFGVDYEKFCNDDADNVNRFNAHSWVAMARDLESYTANAYWLTDNEKQEEIDRARAVWGTSMAIPRHRPNERLGRARDMTANQFTRFCNTCFLNTKCPAYEQNATCTISDKLEITGANDVIFALNDMYGEEVRRLRFAQFAEEVQGTPTSPDTMRHAQAVFAMGRSLVDLQRPRNQQGGTMRLLEITTGSGGGASNDGQKQLNQAQGSILAKMFGMADAPAPVPLPAANDHEFVVIENEGPDGDD